MIVQCPQCRTRCLVDDRNLSQENFQLQCTACSLVFKVADGSDSPEEAEPASAVSTKGRGAAASKTKTVLIVDDSRFFREMIFDILHPLHLNLLPATNGAEALQMIKSERPDLVLLDLNLPIKNGFEVIREVRSTQGFEDLCLLAMSGVYYKEVDAAEAKKVGANDFIKKSFKPEDLQQFVKMWLIW